MLTYLLQLFNASVEACDEALQDTPAHQIILATAAMYFLYNQYYDPWIARSFRARNAKTYQQALIDMVYETAKNIPPVRHFIANELDKNLTTVKEKLRVQRAQMTLQKKMPAEGTPVDLILKEFNIDSKECAFDFGAVNASDKKKKHQVQQGDGQDSGALYAVYPQELSELLKEVYAKTALTNPLHEKWPRINAMQAEIISWCQDLFHGSEEGYGIITHGGSSSIIEAMTAYVIHAKAQGIKHPEIVVPETAHAAFKKAADFSGATLIKVPIDKKTGAVSAAEMRKYISRNTAVIVGSAPSYMNGINDPIEELGQLALEKSVPFHVDACLGGFLTAFLDTTEAPMDFRVEGVTSISADTHKYGYCPKGTSVCLYSKNSPALPVYAVLNWSGGLYVTPGLLDGSTSGARIAEIYTTLSYFGRKKYQEISQAIITLRERLQTKIAELSDKNPQQDIYVYGNPQWSILGFRSDTLNPYLIADELEKRGWKVNLLQKPAGFHFCLTHVHTLMDNFEDRFIVDLDYSINTVKSYPADKKTSGNVKVYGAVDTMPTSVQQDVSVQYQRARLFFEDSVNKEQTELITTNKPAQ